MRTLTAEEAQSGCADAPAALKAPDRATQEASPADGEDLVEGLKSGMCIQDVDTPQARCGFVVKD
jgi:hypothetical protein